MQVVARVALHLRNQRESSWSWLIVDSGQASATSATIHPFMRYTYVKDNIWRCKYTFNVLKPSLYCADTYILALTNYILICFSLAVHIILHTFRLFWLYITGKSDPWNASSSENNQLLFLTKMLQTSLYSLFSLYTQSHLCKYMHTHAQVEIIIGHGGYKGWQTKGLN